MKHHYPGMLYVVYLWSMGKPLPSYFADSDPDMRAIAALPRITQIICRKAYFSSS